MPMKKADPRKFKPIPGGTELKGRYGRRLGFYWPASGAFFAQLVGGRDE